MSTTSVLIALSPKTGKAVCTDVDPSIIDNDDEAMEPSATAQILCASCDIQRVCLAAGLSLPPTLDYGIWGGTTSYQRATMKGRHVTQNAGSKDTQSTKPRCPGCKSSIIINEHGSRSRRRCLECGIDWSH